jgi:hypothetical protein
VVSSFFLNKLGDLNAPRIWKNIKGV